MVDKMPVISYMMRSLALMLLCAFITACGGAKKTSSVPKTATLTKKQRTHYAEVLDVSHKAITHDRLYLFIDEWWGVKYKYGGNTKEGVDCSGFVNQLYRAVYGTNILRTSLLLYENSKLIRNRKNLKEGDLVFFATNNSDKNKVSHVGLYLMNSRFVHVPTRGGVMINTLDDEYWNDRYLCGGRVR